MCRNGAAFACTATTTATTRRGILHSATDRAAACARTHAAALWLPHRGYRKEQPEMTIPHHHPQERPAKAGECGGGESRELEARQPGPVTYDDAARRYGPGT